MERTHLYQSETARPGFTLTELLVVIAIIGVLASLITVAAKAAWDRGRVTSVVLELKNMSGAMDNFKNDLGDYPPNVMNDGSTEVLQQVTNDALRMFKRAYPRMNPQEQEVVRALCNATYDTSIVTDSTVENGLTAAEALVFWLGGFSADEQFPLSGPGGPSFDNGNNSDGEVLENRKWRWEFNTAQFGPRDDDGFFDDGRGHYVEYQLDMNGDEDETDPGEVRRINLWHYKPKGSEQPYLYFDVSRYKPSQFDPWAIEPALDPLICAIKQRRAGSTSSNWGRRVAFVDEGKFQILHCGLDDVWGNFEPLKTPLSPTESTVSQMLLYPEGPFTGELADTLTSFSDGTLEDSQEE